MHRSTDRILTTHTGSLHRPPDLEELFRRKLAGEAHDDKAFEARLRSAVAETVQKQLSIGSTSSTTASSARSISSAMRNTAWTGSRAARFP